MSKQQTQERLTQDETTRLLDHVCSRGDMTNQLVADLIEVEPPRISEGRNGKWRLPRDKAAKLELEFGKPRAEKGVYVFAELLEEGIAQARKNIPDLASARHRQRCLDVWHNKEMRRELAQKVIYDETPLDWSAKDERDNDHEFWAGVFEKFDALLASNEFKTLIKRLRDKASSIAWEESRAQQASYELQYNNDFYCGIPIAKKAEARANCEGISLQSLHPFSLLQCAALKELDEGTIVADSRPFDIVVTGELIHEWRGEIEVSIVGASCSKSLVFPIEGNLVQAFPLSHMHLGDRECEFKSRMHSLNVDRYDAFEASLYLTKRLEYVLILTLSEKSRYVTGTPDRPMVITGIRSAKLFDELAHLQDWLGIKDLGLGYVKAELAGLGGYIPGAKII
ncbi:hypothetical protein A3750_13635 [Oleiphilus sp. HI0079]|uniref:hypothetical protein n=1 Tax=Oleiphilus sp. HI0079 TaxID=1822254 RepID=UPI0007C37F7B|nr:hypothetical protein [Oleiphilus sp. HI0079]KZZ14742.1 hypothetical protein A3750_13635 [Oleiphilus sp. HI0079]